MAARILSMTMGAGRAGPDRIAGAGEPPCPRAGLRLAEADGGQGRLPPMRGHESTADVGTRHPQHLVVDDRDRDRLLLDLLVQLAPQVVLDVELVLGERVVDE